MTAISSNVKNRIVALLNELKVAGVLGEVRSEDLKTHWTVMDAAAFPVAIVTPPAISSDYFTNRQNERHYAYSVHVVQKAENIASSTDIEDLIEAILDKFDNDPTLGNTSDAGVEPAATQPEPVTSGDKSYVAFTVSLKAKAVINLTF